MRGDADSDDFLDFGGIEIFVGLAAVAAGDQHVTLASKRPFRKSRITTARNSFTAVPVHCAFTLLGSELRRLRSGPQ